MQPTKQQWDEIAERLDCLMSPVYLRCDGYLVTAHMVRTRKNSLGISVGVNGYLYKGIWFGEGWKEHEEPRRFWRRTTRQRMKAKELKLWEKLLGKRKCKAKGYYEPIIHANPIWLRPRSFIAHLRKHNERIEVIDYDTYAAEVEALRRAEERPDV